MDLKPLEAALAAYDAQKDDMPNIAWHAFQESCDPDTIRALLADARRLDWLEKNQASLYTCTHTEWRAVTDGSNRREGYVMFDGWAVGMNQEERPTVREALDAAIDAALKGKQP